MDVRREESAPRKPTLSTNEARQGITGHHVRYVLIAGTTSAIILLALIYAFYFAG